MRVTGIIKDYITSEVNKKYEEKLNSIPNEYKELYDKCIDEIEQLVNETNEKAKDICKRYNMLKVNKANIIKYSSYDIDNKEMANERHTLVRQLKQERDDKIAQIILDLELGETTKKELTEVLSKVEF